jgi:hypothetical protein
VRGTWKALLLFNFSHKLQFLLVAKTVLGMSEFHSLDSVNNRVGVRITHANAGTRPQLAVVVRSLRRLCVIVHTL